MSKINWIKVVFIAVLQVVAEQKVNWVYYHINFAQEIVVCLEAAKKYIKQVGFVLPSRA